MPNPQKSIVMVTGSGRSGTSLAMQLLHGAGLRVSQQLIGGSFGNPHGHWEDAEIVAVHQDLLSEISGHPSAPLPVTWTSEPAARRAERRLIEIIESRLADDPSLFGFKDPRLCILMPLWFKVLNKTKTAPKIIVCLRHPNAVSTSMNLNYGTDPRAGYLTWLVRNIEMIRATRGDFFVAQYEHWQSNGQEQLDEMIDYCGISRALSERAGEDLLKERYDKKHEHAKTPKATIENPIVRRLYGALKKCHGTDFDRQMLSSVVDNIHSNHQLYAYWAEIVGEKEKKIRDMLEREAESEGQAATKKTGSFHLISSEQLNTITRVRRDTRKIQDDVESVEKNLSEIMISLQEIRGDLERQKNDTWLRRLSKLAGKT